jgi:serine/threonine-protein kinase
MGLTLDQFGKALATLGLVSSTELKELWDTSAGPKPKNAAELAKWLVEHGKLTPYQAEETLVGRGAGLIYQEYLVLSKLGEGGMGQVFKAQHRRMKRVVALKVMSAKAVKNESDVKRFQREVEAAARLEHPNIVTAYDAGEHRGVHFLVMQYVDGSDLQTLVTKGGPLSIDQAINCIRQAAVGLAYAHGEGIIHRDIKPANLLLDKKGVVKILDMGLARVEGGNEGLTATEQMMGTVDYMSPEQATNSRGADGRADIYSLGCTLWFLLTGKRVYDSEFILTRVMQHREAEIPSLMSVRDDVPWVLEQVFHKMLAKQPVDRQQSMEEVAAALEAAQGASGNIAALVANQGDNSLNDFLRRIGDSTSGGTDSGTRHSGVRLTAKTESSPNATVSQSSADVGTDPNARSIGTQSPSKIPGRTQQRRPVVIIGGAIAACALVGVGAFAWLMNRSGDHRAEHVPPKLPKASLPQPNGPTAPPLARAPFNATQALAHQNAWAKHLGLPREASNSVGMKMAIIPPGDFLMGATPKEMTDALSQATTESTKSWIPGFRSEGPQHRVTLSQPYLLGTCEVTVGQFAAYVKATSHVTTAEQSGTASGFKSGKASRNPAFNWRNPGYEQTDGFPVVNVSWSDAAAFCNWLSAKESLPFYYESAGTSWRVRGGNGYRLPTEAEWEYACRAGTQSAYSWGEKASERNAYGHFSGGGGGPRAPVGQSVANAFGLCDMHGNVSEWCQDWYSVSYYEQAPPVDPPGPSTGNLRVTRGAPMDLNEGVLLRSAYRGWYAPDVVDYTRGFRVARSLVATTTNSSSPAAAPSNAQSPGPVDYALEFDGAKSHVVVPWKYDGALPITIECWVMPLAGGPSGYRRAMGNNETGGLGLTTTMFELHDGGKDYRRVAYEQPISNGFKAHLAGVYDGSKMRVFVNGKPQGQPLEVTSKHQASKLPFVIGGDPTTASDDPELRLQSPFRGYIDEVRISQVARYDGDFTPVARFEADRDTVALYHFDEGSGVVAHDSSANGHHAAIRDASWTKTSVIPRWPPFKPTNPADRNRTVAEWGLWSGAKLKIEVPAVNGAFVEVDVPDTNSLPSGEMYVSSIEYPDTGTTPGAIENFRGLTRLKRFIPNFMFRFRDAEAKLLAEFSQLEYLKVSCNYEVTHEGLAALKSLKQLKGIFLYNIEIREPELAVLLQLPQLETVHLIGVKLEEAEYLRMLTLPNLKVLTVAGAPLTDRVIDELAKHPQITSIGLANSKLTSHGIRALAKLNYLTGLQLDTTPCTDADVVELAKLQNLSLLRLPNTPLTDVGLAHLAKLSKLTYLTVRQTKITAAGVKALQAALPNCKIDWDGPPVAAATSAAPSSPAASTSPDRTAAEWVLSVGGKLSVLAPATSGGAAEIEIATATDLPKGIFRVSKIVLTKNDRVTDQGLAHLAGLTNLAYLDLELCPITDAGLLSLAELTNLTHLNLGNIKGITDAGISHLAKLNRLSYFAVTGGLTTNAVALWIAKNKGLTTLRLPSGNFTDDGLAQLTGLTELVSIAYTGPRKTSITPRTVEILRQFPNLRTLNLGYSGTSDEVLPLLIELPAMRTLQLHESAITDAGIQHLVKFTQLEALNIGKTRVTEAGYQKAKADLPKCTVFWEALAPGALPAGVSLDREAANWVLSLGGMASILSPATNGGRIETEVSDVKKLPDGEVWLSKINLHDVRSVADRDLERIRGFTTLTELDLYHSKVTSAGVPTLATLTGLKKLLLTGCPLVDDDLAKLAALVKLEYLDLGGTKIDGSGLKHLAPLRSLKLLQAHGTQVNGAGLLTLPTFDQLETLTLNDVLELDAGLAALGRLPRLRSLSIYGKRVSDATLSGLPAIATLESLGIDGSSVTSTGLAELTRYPKLATLHIARTSLGDESVNTLGKLTSLRRLYVHNAKFTPEGLESLRKLLPKCEIKQEKE